MHSLIANINSYDMDADIPPDALYLLRLEAASIMRHIRAATTTWEWTVRFIYPSGRIRYGAPSGDRNMIVRTVMDLRRESAEDGDKIIYSVVIRPTEASPDGTRNFGSWTCDEDAQ